MSGSKPGERRGGRRKGTPNKVPSDLKRMILGALDGVGGEKYLMQQAIENPGPFMALIGKVLPTTLASDPDNPPKQTVSVEVRIAAVRAMLDAAYGEDGKDAALMLPQPNRQIDNNDISGLSENTLSLVVRRRE